jgi:hypothetical protein
MEVHHRRKTKIGSIVASVATHPNLTSTKVELIGLVLLRVLALVALQDKDRRWKGQ